MADWKTIESAPKDKTVLLIGEDGSMGIGQYSAGKYWLFVDAHGYGSDHFNQPTHWHPVPEFYNG
jgi:hypothetical protein